MSYVLDALRRADAERHSGAVPTLHAQPLPAPGTSAETVAPPRWLWALLVALLLALVALAALWLGGRPVPSPAAPTPALPGAPAVPAPQPSEQAAIAPRPVPPMPVQRRPVAPPVAEKAGPPVDTDARPVPWAQLPDALRRQLPAMAFGGATDSTVATARMLIINGQIHREGDEVAPGLVLERIALRSAQMRYQGRRFEVTY